LICVSGIAVSDLKKRIEDIMRNRVALKLSLTRLAFLAVAAMAALAGPIIFGIVNVNAGETQSENTGIIASRQAVQVQSPQPAAIQIASEPQAGTRGTSTPVLVREYRISEISVTGVKSQQLNESIRSLLGMGVGDIYDESRLRKAFEDMRKLYGSLGYVDFMPDPYFDFDEGRKVVALTIFINEGRQYFVNSIHFTGNTTTREDVLRREILLKEGEVFNSSLLDNALLRLNQMGVFEGIKPEDVAIDILPNEPKLDIDIRVKEKAR